MVEGEEEVAVVGEEVPAVVRNLHLWTENAMRLWQRLQEPVVVAVAADVVVAAAAARGINLRLFEDGDVGISLDQTTTPGSLAGVVLSFGGGVDWQAADEEAASLRPMPPCRWSSLPRMIRFRRYEADACPLLMPSSWRI